MLVLARAGGDSAAIGIYIQLHLPRTSWDLGPRQYLSGDNSALSKSNERNHILHVAAAATKRLVHESLVVMTETVLIPAIAEAEVIYTVSVL